MNGKMLKKFVYMCVMCYCNQHINFNDIAKKQKKTGIFGNFH